MIAPIPLAEAAEACYLGTDLIFARKPQTSSGIKRKAYGHSFDRRALGVCQNCLSFKGESVILENGTRIVKG